MTTEKWFRFFDLAAKAVVSTVFCSSLVAGMVVLVMLVFGSPVIGGSVALFVLSAVWLLLRENLPQEKK